MGICVTKIGISRAMRRVTSRVVSGAEIEAWQCSACPDDLSPLVYCQNRERGVEEVGQMTLLKVVLFAFLPLPLVPSGAFRLLRFCLFCCFCICKHIFCINWHTCTTAA